MVRCGVALLLYRNCAKFLFLTVSVNRSPIQYGFLAGAKAMQYSVNKFYSLSQNGYDSLTVSISRNI